MQKWLIGDRIMHLCDECTRNHAGVILVLEAQWMESVRGGGLRCDACRCTDYDLIKFGRFRRFFSFFSSLNSRGSAVFFKILGLDKSVHSRALRRGGQ